MIDMHSFPSPLIYEDVSLSAGEFKIILTQDFHYVDDTYGIIRVPKNFDSNLCSVPQKFQWLISKVGPYDIATCVHDWLYASQWYSKEICDSIFLTIMKKSNISYWKRYTMYYAVKYFADENYSECKVNRDYYRGLLI